MIDLTGSRPCAGSSNINNTHKGPRPRSSIICRCLCCMFCSSLVPKTWLNLDRRSDDHASFRDALAIRMEPPALSTSHCPPFNVILSLGLHPPLSSLIYLRGASDLSCCGRDNVLFMMVLRHAKAPSISHTRAKRIHCQLTPGQHRRSGKRASGRLLGVPLSLHGGLVWSHGRCAQCHLCQNTFFRIAQT